MGILLLPRLAPDAEQASAGATVPDEIRPAPTCPYSEGISVEQAQFSYIGIGAALNHKLDADGYVRIARPFPDSPAEKAGVQSEDLILSVDGVSVQTSSVETVIRMIRNGNIGSDVQLTLRRADESEPVELAITRERIYPPSRRE
jgi:carboxyl-terminal processing protease